MKRTYVEEQIKRVLDGIDKAISEGAQGLGDVTAMVTADWTDTDYWMVSQAFLVSGLLGEDYMEDRDEEPSMEQIVNDGIYNLHELGYKTCDWTWVDVVDAMSCVASWEV